MPARSFASGVTLIELLVVLAILGILSAIAYPSYVRYVQKSHRSSAEAILSQTTTYLERYYTANNNSYMGATLPSAVVPLGATGNNVKYNISYVEAGVGVSTTTVASTFTLRAVPAGSQVSDSCGTLTLSNTGAQTPATGCW